METNAPKAPPPLKAAEPPIAQTKPDPANAASQPTPLTPPDAPAYISQPADYRLVIDRDPVSGTLVYKTVDRFSGAVVNQYPREEIVRLRDSLAYKAGTIFTAKV